jgi:nucleotide-binding universal stress UspA family protein
MYKKILFAVDLNDEWSWHKSLSTTITMCKAFDSKLEIISVIPEYGMSWVGEFFPKGYELKMLKRHQSRMQAFVETHIPEELQASYYVDGGRIYEKIIERAEQIDADLIIMASHNPSAKDHLLGPNASKVVKHTNRSVLVVRG